MLKQITKKIFNMFMVFFILLFVVCIFFNSTLAKYQDSNGIWHMSEGEEATISDDYDLITTDEPEDREIDRADELDWDSNSMQGKINSLWESNGKPTDAHGWAYVVINGKAYYLIATGQWFGYTGDYLIITLKDGRSYPCLMGDAKDPSQHSEEISAFFEKVDSEQHHLGNWYNKTSQLNIVELMLGTGYTWTETAGGETLTEKELGQVASIINGGNYEDNPEGPVGADGITFTYTAGTGGSSTFAEDFKKNKVGAVVNKILDFFVAISDGIQMGINYSMRNAELHIGTKLRYTYSELEADVGPEQNNDGAGNRNAYTNVGGYVSGGNSASDVKKGQIGIDITETYYNLDTKIPLITIDTYNLAINDIDFFDINYFTGDETHESGSAWMIIRNIAVAVIQVALYVSIILLITMLIWYGVALVSTGINNPEKHRDYKEGINKFAMSIFMIIGTVLISSLCIFGTDALSKLIMVDTVNSDGEESSSEYELPIRVHVSSAGYSFSTNFTGYVRYMIQIDDVDYYGTRAMYVIVYLGLVVLNLLSLLVMMLRVFVLYGWVVYGLYIAIRYMFDKDATSDKIPDKYVSWIEVYCLISAAQLIYAIIYRILMQFVLL